MKGILFFFLLILLFGTTRSDAEQPASVAVYRAGLKKAIAFADSSPDLFPAEKREEPRMLTMEQKLPVCNAWKSFVDYVIALEDIRAGQSGFYRLHGSAKEESFLTGYAAFLAQYRYSLEWIERVEKDRSLVILLNDPVPDLGLAAGTYDSLKYRFLNVERGVEFAAWEAAYKAMGGKALPDLRAAIRKDAHYIWNVGKGKGEMLTGKNGLSILKRAGFQAWLPLQSGVSEWMGDTRVHRRNVSLITQDQVKQAVAKLQPGDILFERREWYLSNIGLPGFWSHAALYVGTPEERTAYFGDDPEVKAWIVKQGGAGADGDLNRLIRSRFPEAYANSLKPFEGHAPRILEAMSEGVVFTSVEHSAAADSLAVLRPRLSKQEKAVALLHAFHYAGRPYDFNFDFLTDAAIVCSELIYKAYEPAESLRGLRFRLLDILGRKATPPNDMVKQFDEECGTPGQQMDMVLFLDGIEKAGKAVDSTLDQFRTTWKRPKWYILKQGSM